MKLYRALSEAGLKTQQALSERIASLEGLEAAPRDAVNRAFREQPVELITLERIARALGVETFALLLTSEDGTAIDVAEVTPEVAVPLSMNRLSLLTAASLLVLVAAVLMALWSRESAVEQVEPDGLRAAMPVILDLRDPGILIPTFAADTDRRLTSAVRLRIADGMRVASTSADAVFRDPDPLAVLKRLGADLLLEGEIVRIGRMTAVRAYVQHERVRSQIWAESVPSHEFAANVDAVAGRVANAVEYLLGRAPEPPVYPRAAVQDEYLHGIAHLDQPFNEINLMRAQARFQAALRQDEGYAQARAGLCRALVEFAWLEDEDRRMADAAGVCRAALESAPDNHEVLVAYAHYLRAAGRTAESIEHFQGVLEEDENHAAALSGMAFSAMLHFRRTAEPEYLAVAMNAARRASEADPGEWRAPFFLASMEYFSGDLGAALGAASEAVVRSENEMTLTNFGTLSFCAGNVEKARDAYIRAAEIAPSSYVGNEFLGMVHYYLSDYEESARLRALAIESQAGGQPEMHEMWGNLADSHRHSGNVEDAIRAYRRAIEILEREFLRGGVSKAEHAARAWYFTALATLDDDWSESATMELVDESLAELVDADFDPASLVRAAKTWLARGDVERARAALDGAVRTCSVYTFEPDLAHLADN